MPDAPKTLAEALVALPVTGPSRPKTSQAAAPASSTSGSASFTASSPLKNAATGSPT